MPWIARKVENVGIEQRISGGIGVDLGDQRSGRRTLAEQRLGEELLGRLHLVLQVLVLRQLADQIE